MAIKTDQLLALFCHFSILHHTLLLLSCRTDFPRSFQHVRHHRSVQPGHLSITVQKEVHMASERVSDPPLTVVTALFPEENALANALTARKRTPIELFLGAQPLDAFSNRSVHTFA